MKNLKKEITFEYRCLLHDKWVQYLSKKLKLDELTVALTFAKKFSDRLDRKYVVC